MPREGIHMHSNPGPELLKALAALQAEHVGTGKSGYNNFGKYNFATLGDVLKTIRAAAGLCVCQILYSLPKEDGSLATGLRTVLAHSESGQMLVSEICLPDPIRTEQVKDGDTGEIYQQAKKNWEQDWGSTLTYFKKYALLSIAGLANEDDDGQKAEAKADPKPVKKPAAKEVKQTKAKVIPLEKAIKPAEASSSAVKNEASTAPSESQYLVERSDLQADLKKVCTGIGELKKNKPEGFTKLFAALRLTFPDTFGDIATDKFSSTHITTVEHLNFLQEALPSFGATNALR